MLKRRGLTHVRPLAGGLAGWREKGFPIEARKVSKQPAGKHLMEPS
jgi:3-mercaptopyruvate sulfurtransferase SseA